MLNLLIEHRQALFATLLGAASLGAIYVGYTGLQKLPGEFQTEPDRSAPKIESFLQPSTPQSEPMAELALNQVATPRLESLPSGQDKIDAKINVNKEMSKADPLPIVPTLAKTRSLAAETVAKPSLKVATAPMPALPASRTKIEPFSDQPIDNASSPLSLVAKVDEQDPKPAPMPSLQLETDLTAVSTADTALRAPLVIEDRYKPKFDLVRVEPDGSALIAGKAPAGAIVTILSDGIELGQTKATARGEFVAFISTVPDKEVQTLELKAATAEGPVIISDDTVLLLAKTRTDDLTLPKSETSPMIVKSSPQGLSVVAAPGLAELDHVTLDAISYDAKGEVVLTGRGVPGQRVFIYADDDPLGANSISESGSWSMVLNGLTAGRYTLRVDEVNAAGTVTSRVESPFQRVYPSDELLLAGLTRKNVIVQPGSNLWTIASVRYGDGTKYAQIFSANKDRIRDPDLIYPGQIFDLPEEKRKQTGPVKRPRLQ